MNSRIKTTFKTSLFEALMPFSIALAMMVFVVLPHTTHAATTYCVDMYTQSAYDCGGSYGGYGSNCGQCGSGYGQYGYGQYGSQQYNNANNYPYYTYQYYKNPNPYGVGQNNSGYGSGYGSTYGNSYTQPYVPMTASYTPYPYPEYVQYVRQADGTYKLGTPKQIPTYAWNADNSIPTSAYGTGYGSAYGTGYGTGYGSGYYPPTTAGRGFVITSQGY